MLRSQEIIWCPVGKHQELGYRTKGTAAVFVCRECGFAFPFDKNGKSLPPTKISRVHRAQPCDCGRCGR